jgi:transcriptional regulator with GAF, ATPase, and Fis domain
MILEALSQAGGVQNRAAKLLGMDRRNLSYFLNKHQIHRQWRARGATAGGAE